MSAAGVVVGTLIFLYAGWWGQYYRSPSLIEIQEDGILFINRYTKPRFISYDQIVALGIFEKRGRGGIILSKGDYYPITYEIAWNIRDAYIKKTGGSPRVWNGRMSAKAFRRSIGMEK